ncbi:MAG: cupin domain-containing protein [Bacteroidota bacterium]|nr:cupin domain-containing protein [Bacteroidota bacterium]MDP3143782.1 cupin domain-containing protein [Bacteroidota bacterium]MDP3556963.1 cupin domain-containing protein [Bacteroidota bacterium]
MNVSDYIQSGILEMYLLGITSSAETTEVEEMANKYPMIRAEIDALSKDIELYASFHAVNPSPTIKPFLMASIDYSERIKNGETPSFPPMLNINSKVEDFGEWLNRKDIVLPDDFTDFYAKIIGHTQQMVTAVVWIGKMAPEEIHDDEHEKFLILEGTCDIIVENNVHHLKAGDFFEIPLHKTHTVKITSDVPCKTILQRMAA